MYYIGKKLEMLEILYLKRKEIYIYIYKIFNFVYMKVTANCIILIKYVNSYK